MRIRLCEHALNELHDLGISLAAESEENREIITHILKAAQNYLDLCVEYDKMGKKIDFTFRELMTSVLNDNDDNAEE